MSDNERQTQNRPTRRSVSSERRAVGNVRPRTGSAGRTSARTSDGTTERASARQDVDSTYTRDSSYTRRTDYTSRRSASVENEPSEGGILESLKGAVEHGREAISSRVDSGSRDSLGEGGDGPIQKVMSMLPESDWVRRGIIIVALLIAILILFNLVTCIAGAVSGPASNSASSQATASASSEAASASSAAAQQGVSSPWTADGTFSTGDNTLDTYIKNLCDGHSTEGASYDANAYDTYLYVSRTDYIERSNNQSPWGSTWDVEYAKQYFEEGQTGNCYNYAAVIEYILKYFGYSDAEAEPCVVGLESGAWGDHGLVFVTNKVDNKRCLIDSSLSANGWMLDIDSYQYDIRNIDQNSTIQGNVDVLNDNDTPTRIPAGELTETSSSAASADATTTDEEATSEDEGEEPVYVEETADDEVYYEDDGSGDYEEEGDYTYDESEDDGSYEEETYDEGGDEGYYDESEEEEY